MLRASKMAELAEAIALLFSGKGYDRALRICLESGHVVKQSGFSLCEIVCAGEFVILPMRYGKPLSFPVAKLRSTSHKQTSPRNSGHTPLIKTRGPDDTLDLDRASVHFSEPERLLE